VGFSDAVTFEVEGVGVVVAEGGGAGGDVFAGEAIDGVVGPEGVGGEGGGVGLELGFVEGMAGAVGVEGVLVMGESGGTVDGDLVGEAVEVVVGVGGDDSVAEGIGEEVADGIMSVS